MITWFVLFLVVSAALGYVSLPLWQEARRPWLLHTPMGEEEALRQEQMTALDALRDLALDVKLGNLAVPDYQALAAPLQKKAKRTLEIQAQLRQAAPTALDPRRFRADRTKQVDEELDVRLEREIASARQVGRKNSAPDGTPSDTWMAVESVHFCPQCGQPVSPQFRFCAGCGAKLPGGDGANPAPVSVSAPTVPVSPRPDPQPGIHMQPSSTPLHDATKLEMLVAPQGMAPQAAELVTLSSPRMPAIALAQPFRVTNRKTGAWLWRGGLFVAACWVVAVIWLYLSSRAGMTNQVPVATFDDVSIRSLAVGGDLVLMGESKGIRISSDGQKWSSLPVAGDIRGFAPLDSAGNNWLAAGPDGLWRSTDGGNGWQPMITTPADLGLVTIASVTGQPGLVWGASNAVLYRSEDSGGNWTRIESRLPGTPRVLDAGTTDHYLGTSQGVFRSMDGGLKWVDISGSMNGAIASLDIRALAFDESNGLLYAGTPAGLSFQKLSSPGSWGQRSLRGDVTALTLDGVNHEVLWVGTSAGLLLRSRDRGVTW